MASKALPSPVALILVGIAGLCSSVNAAEWQTQLGTGQPIAVDPTTNRAVIQSGVGQGRPLWDGVHRLRDGSTITIRSGVVVPNEALSGPLPPTKPPPTAADRGNAETAQPDATEGQRPANGIATAPRSRTSQHRGHCDHLVLKTCGLNGHCRDTEACQLARQLRTTQQGSIDPGLDNTGWAEQHCREALRGEDGFAPCDTEPALEESACGALVDRVCASASRCRRSETCKNARELFDLERVALQESSTDELGLVRRRCIELLAGHAFFPPCR